MKLILNDEQQQQNSKDEALKRWRKLLGPAKFGRMYLAQVGDFDEIDSNKKGNFRQLFGLSDSRNFGLFIFNFFGKDLLNWQNLEKCILSYTHNWLMTWSKFWPSIF